MSFWDNFTIDKGPAKDNNNLKQPVNNVSAIDNPNDYSQMLGNYANQWNTTPDMVEDIMNRISYHETGPSQRMDPGAVQAVGVGTNIDGTTEYGRVGPGKGLFQFESGLTDTGGQRGGMTARNYLEDWYVKNQMDVPSWLTQPDMDTKGFDASKLSEEQQKMLFMANIGQHKTRSLEGVAPENLANWWNEHHYAGPENKMDLFNESMNAYDVNYKPTAEEIAFP
jgi:hypothetical protein